MKRICVFCGSSPGRLPEYAESARRLGRVLGSRGLGLVYGGGSVGMMGVVADGALEAGAEVIGVIPKPLAVREVMHEGLSRLEVVGSMHERKARMAALSDAFLALPGGIGTLEEFCEIFTWGQLGIHAKPFGLLNVAGYFDGFLAFLDHATAEGFIQGKHRDLIVVDRDPEPLLASFESWRAPAEKRWIGWNEI